VRSLKVEVHQQVYLAGNLSALSCSTSTRSIFSIDLLVLAGESTCEGKSLIKKGSAGGYRKFLGATKSC
jgi:hypothetical protein